MNQWEWVCSSGSLNHTLTQCEKNISTSPLIFHLVLFPLSVKPWYQFVLFWDLTTQCYFIGFILFQTETCQQWRGWTLISFFVFSSSSWIGLGPASSKARSCQQYSISPSSGTRWSAALLKQSKTARTLTKSRLKSCLPREVPFVQVWCCSRYVCIF